MNNVNLVTRISILPTLKTEEDGTKKVRFFINVYSESLKEHKLLAVVGKNEVAIKLEKIMNLQDSFNTKKFSALVSIQGFLDFFEKAQENSAVRKDLSCFIVCEKISIFEANL